MALDADRLGTAMWDAVKANGGGGGVNESQALAIQKAIAAAIVAEIKLATVQSAGTVTTGAGSGGAVVATSTVIT